MELINIDNSVISSNCLIDLDGNFYNCYEYGHRNLIERLIDDKILDRNFDCSDRLGGSDYRGWILVSNLVLYYETTKKFTQKQIDRIFDIFQVFKIEKLNMMGWYKTFSQIMIDNDKINGVD